MANEFFLPVKVEYQQYPDGTHVCMADNDGNWLADFGPEGNVLSEYIAEVTVKAFNKFLPKENASKGKTQSNAGDEKIRLVMMKLIPLSITAYDMQQDAKRCGESNMRDYWKGQHEAFGEVSKILNETLSKL